MVRGGIAMKIASSNVQMSAVSSREQSVSFRHETTQIFTTQGALREAGLIGSGVSLTLSDEARAALEKAAEEPEQNNSLTDEMNRAQNDRIRSFINNSNNISVRHLSSRFMLSHNEFKMDLLRSMMEALTGRKFRVNPLPEMGGQQGQNQVSATQEHIQAQWSRISQLQMSQQDLQALQDRQPAVLTFTNVTLERFERENVCFTAQAHITTECGMEIDIDIALNMTREIYERFDFSSFTTMQFVDPLVINFDTDMARLCDTKFEFDLDASGTPNQISRLLQGSGYLAKCNGSGEVQDGSQLFGALCGNGFAHLTKYDTDGNGWIDANDEVWDSLRIWVHNPDGTNSLLALGEVGIGAIFLGSVETDFTLAGDSGDVNGMLRRTGFFLFTDGSAGTVQHLDLRV